MRPFYLIILLILFSNIGVSKADIFNNFAELDSCISGYKSFNDYKSKLQSCYKDKGVNFDKETFNSLSKKKKCN